MKHKYTLAVIITAVAVTFLCCMGPYLDNDDITDTLTAKEKVELILELKNHPNRFQTYSILEDMSERTYIVAENDKYKIMYHEDKSGSPLRVFKKRNLKSY